MQIIFWIHWSHLGRAVNRSQARVEVRLAVDLVTLARQRPAKETIMYFLFSRRKAIIKLQCKNTSVVVPDPDPYVFGPPGSASGSVSHKYGPGSFHHQAKIVRKNLISTDLWLLYDFLPVFRTESGLGSVESVCFLGLPDPHLDPLNRGTDPRIRIRIRIRIRTKISRIHNTEKYKTNTSMSRGSLTWCACVRCCSGWAAQRAGMCQA